MNAGSFHFFDRPRNIIGFQIHAARSVFDEMSFKAELDGVKRGEFDTVVGCESCDEYIGDLLAFEEVAQAGRFAMAVVKKATVAVNAGIGAFLKDARDAVCVQTGNERCAGSVLDAMNRPENLRQAVEINLVGGFFARMICGKAAVIGWVPVLSGDDEIEFGLESVYERNDFIAFRDGKRATGNEIVLEVNED